MSKRRVAITGLGWVTSLGAQVNDVFSQLIAGNSGVSAISKFDTSEYSTKIGGEISTWDGGEHLDKRDAKRMDRFAQFALSATIDAVNDAKLDFSNEDPWRCGAVIGSG